MRTADSERLKNRSHPDAPQHNSATDRQTAGRPRRAIARRATAVMHKLVLLFHSAFLYTVIPCCYFSAT